MICMNIFHTGWLVASALWLIFLYLSTRRIRADRQAEGDLAFLFSTFFYMIFWITWLAIF